MAMPYPEGEVFFQRTTLKTKSFDPDDVSQFTSRILVEYIYNRPNEVSNNRAYSNTVEIHGSKYYYPHNINFMFAKTLTEKPCRQLRVSPCENAADYEQSSKGGTDKVLIRPIHVKSGERYMYIDLEVPIRAIYIPFSHKVEGRYEDICSYLMVDFRYRKGAYMRGFSRPSGAIFGLPFGGREMENAKLPDGRDTYQYKDDAAYRWQSFSHTEGLGIRSNTTLLVDLHGVANYLVVPRQMRNPDKGLYFPSKSEDILICFADLDTSRHSSWDVEDQSFDLAVDYLNVIKDNFGIDVVWKPCEHKADPAGIVQQISVIAGGAGLSLLPVVGPLLSIGWVYFVDAIYDPEGFKVSNVLKLDEGTLTAIAASAELVAENIAAARAPKGVTTNRIGKFIKT